MVRHCSVPDGLPRPAARIFDFATPLCPAEAMTPPKRRQLALEALAGAETVSCLAGEHAVSRKFVYQQTAKADKALDAAFAPAEADDQKVLFHLPVTKARSQLGSRYFPLSTAMAGVARRTVRASSLVENLNSRLGNYFFLRRHLGPDYLALLQFFLNHRRFIRSERPERAGKSPAELLGGNGHPHWLEMLGHVRFSRS